MHEDISKGRGTDMSTPLYDGKQPSPIYAEIKENFRIFNKPNIYVWSLNKITHIACIQVNSLLYINIRIYIKSYIRFL